jgi:hypothetical protein
MFGDYGWDDRRTSAQLARLNGWLQQVRRARMVIIECGAGTAIPTVRQTCEELAGSHHATLVRINLREPAVPEGHVGMAVGALAGLRAIDERLRADRAI